MPYDTQADFAAVYAVYLTDPETGERYKRLRSMQYDNGQTEVTVRMHYHRTVLFAGKEKLADRVIAHSGITGADSIILFGGGFGWLGEWIEQKTGASCVSVDTSQWINDVQAQSGDDELAQAITGGGLDPTVGIGKQVYDKFKDPGPRCRISGGVAKETLANHGSRQRVIAKLPRNPTLVITEEVWQVLTDAERTDYTARLASFGIPVIHIIDNQITDG